MKFTRRDLLKSAPLLLVPAPARAAADPALPFGADFPKLESLTTGEWWKQGLAGAAARPNSKPRPAGEGGPPAAPSMDVPREDVICFACYTQQNNILKLSAQLFPLKPGEARLARLEVKPEGQDWREIAQTEVLYPGWDAHFRVQDWDGSKTVPYRVRHGAAAVFEGLIRRDPVEKTELVIANMSCNSSRTIGPRTEIIENLRAHDPDVLFFGGDQTYRHTEHTAGWIEFGLQFREIMRDRPTVCIPDDHDVGHANLWGESGKLSSIEGGADGGFRYPVAYVNQVQRQQSWHLPDPVDPAAVGRDVGVYFTRMVVAGIDFAILEDRKFKSGPSGKIPQMGPRPDHINDPSYDPATVDLPGLQLLGKRQEDFLHRWSQDYSQGAEMKCVLSATAFCGAVHMHGGRDQRLLADLDCNGWPQSGRNRALVEIRRAWAPHLCGDQHLAVVVRHGITGHGDGPYAFTSPALVNTIYGRWWHPADEKPGPNPVANSPLPWTGDYKDGLGNKISMLAYANPDNMQDEKQRADGYGLIRFNKTTRKITFECWPRFAKVSAGDQAQFPGWPITISQEANDGRKTHATLPAVKLDGVALPVVQVTAEDTGEILYTVRSQTAEFVPRVYAPGKYTVRIGQEKPDTIAAQGVAV